MKLRIVSAVSLVLIFSTQVFAGTTNTPPSTSTSIAAASDSDKNKIDGQTFLANNAKKPGVVTLPSGLQYKIITAGSGPKPTDNDTVVVEYKGTSIDGKVFDQTKPGAPATFPVGQVIPGWTEALKLMPVGSTWEIYVPANLGYGEQGAPPVIGPNQALVFSIHLININK